MTRYYIKNTFLQRLCCGDVMVTKKKVIIFLVAMAVASALFTTYMLYTLAKFIAYSDNRYAERLREQGAQYKDKFLGNNAVLSNIQAKINDHLNQQQYDKKIKDAYDSAHRAVASNVETFRGKADTIIKQVRQNPRQYAFDTGRQVMGYVQDKGETAGDVLQEVGKKSVDTLQEAGRQSMDTIQQVHADTRDLGNDMRDNPDKYVQKAKQQYKETYDKLEDQASKLGQQANEAMDSMKYSAKVLQRKAARGLKRIEHEIGRARS